MAETSPSQVLATVLDNTRALTLFYLHHAEDVDRARNFTVGGFKTNSIEWIVAHLAWAEDFLILRGVGNQGLDVPWFERFALGAEQADASAYPPFAEAVEILHRVHQRSLELLKTLPEAVLDHANHVGLEFGAGNSNRIVIQHCIRHEGAHAGHLGWLLRMHGKKVI
ncbi:MAG: DinB family protein [Candidatus Zixiibacteriota bacterium]|nr:MAG: DinB family protein [candidate division Zixibacteria bacterium]